MANAVKVSRAYEDFRGVDFLNNNVLLSRSPDAKNIWYNYDKGKVLETRPGQKLLGKFPNGINGIFFYEVNNNLIVVVHSGTKLYTWDNFPNTPIFPSEEEIEEPTVSEIYTDMNPFPSQAFIYNNILFIKDGINYLEYNGEQVKSVLETATIPITSLGRKPSGEIINDDNDVVFQAVNLLQPKRKNAFVADGISTKYYLDTKDLDPSSTFLMTAEVNGLTQVEGTHFSVDRANGIVEFFEAPAEPIQPGENNVIITLSKTNLENINKVLKCDNLEVFDRRVFFSGNIDYPNVLRHSELNDPRYVRDNAEYQEGLDFSKIKALIPGNDVLWVIKEPNQAKTTVFYHIPTIDSTYGKIYPSYQGNISTGCVSTGINFGDDIVFFSNNGMEAISGEITSEKLLSHRSSLIDSKLITSLNYRNMKLAEYKGYLMCLVDSKVFLADSRMIYTNETTGEIEYEWFYWELPNNISLIKEYNGELYYANSNGEIYKAYGDTDNGNSIESYWTTPLDNFTTDSRFKNTNKRGFVVDLKPIENGVLEIYSKTEKDDSFKLIGEYDTTKGYVVCKLKEKKFKELQLKFQSNKMGLFSVTLETFVGAYIKR